MPPSDLDPQFWFGKRVLVTGDTGFKGAWASLWLHQLGAEVFGLALEPEPLSLFRLLRLEDLIRSYFVDLRDATAVARVVAATRPELVLHLAAQPLIHRAMAAPSETFAVNVCGTVHLLDALRGVPDLRAVLVATSDKVYADTQDGRAHPEADRLGGRDPYSASKAACEIATACMAQSFLAEHGVRVATARAGNVIGGGDFSPWRLVPDAVRAARGATPLTLRNPDASRPWQHVLDCLCGYFAYLSALASDRPLPLSLNFGPRLRHRATVADLAVSIQQALGAAQGWTHAPDAATRETQALAIDSRLARRVLGWSDRLSGRRMIASTAAWYQAWAKGADMRRVTLRQIEKYQALP